MKGGEEGKEVMFKAVYRTYEKDKNLTIQKEWLTFVFFSFSFLSSFLNPNNQTTKLVPKENKTPPNGKFLTLKPNIFLLTKGSYSIGLTPPSTSLNVLFIDAKKGQVRKGKGERNKLLVIHHSSPILKKNR